MSTSYSLGAAFVRTISTSLERTLDSNTASASKVPRNKFILTVRLPEKTGRGMLMAKIYASSTSGLSIDSVDRRQDRLRESLVRLGFSPI